MSRSRRLARPRPALAAVVAALAASAALVGPVALPAAAHGGAGAIQLLEASPTAEDEVAIEVCVTYTLDRDQADSARVTMRAQGPEDAEVAAQDMEVGDQPGLRNGTLRFPRPGSWTVIVESTFPPAQLVVPITVGGDDLASPAATAPGAANTAAACKPADNEAPTWLVAGGATAAAVIGFGGLLLLLRRSTTPPA